MPSFSISHMRKATQISASGRSSQAVKILSLHDAGRGQELFEGEVECLLRKRAAAPCTPMSCSSDIRRKIQPGIPSLLVKTCIPSCHALHKDPQDGCRLWQPRGPGYADARARTSASCFPCACDAAEQRLEHASSHRMTAVTPDSPVYSPRVFHHPQVSCRPARDATLAPLGIGGLRWFSTPCPFSDGMVVPFSTDTVSATR
jgi:hypothetical protein